MTTQALVAMTPQDLTLQQGNLIAWISQKQEKVREELKEATDALDAAIRHKWAVSALRSAVNRLERLLTYYDKLKAATEAGYVIMPSLPMNVIAIRTKAKSPKGGTKEYSSRFEQPAQALPQGAGENKSPIPFTDWLTTKETRNGKEQSVTRYWPTDFDDELTMPAELCKPVVLERTQEALALKLFDEIGVVRDVRYGGDPIVVGTIINPTASRRRISFFIAWVLPLADL
jgi:hypothetical protein